MRASVLLVSIQSDMVNFETMANREIDANGPFDAETEHIKIMVTIEICRAERENKRVLANWRGRESERPNDCTNE